MAPKPDGCPTLLIDDAGQPVRLACSANPGHPGTHTAYYRDRLHEWPAVPTHS